MRKSNFLVLASIIAYSGMYGLAQATAKYTEDYTSKAAVTTYVTGTKHYNVQQILIPYSQQSSTNWPGTIGWLFAIGSPFFPPSTGIGGAITDYFKLDPQVAVLASNGWKIGSDLSSVRSAMVAKLGPFDKLSTTTFIAPFDAKYIVSFNIDGSMFTPHNVISLYGETSTGLQVPFNQFYGPTGASSNRVFTYEFNLQAGVYILDALVTDNITGAAPPSLNSIVMVHPHQWSTPFKLDATLFSVGGKALGSSGAFTSSLTLPGDSSIVEGSLYYSIDYFNANTIFNAPNGSYERMQDWNETSIWYNWANSNNWYIEFTSGLDHVLTLFYTRIYKNFSTTINGATYPSMYSYPANTTINQSFKYTIAPTNTILRTNYTQNIQLTSKNGEIIPIIW